MKQWQVNVFEGNPEMHLLLVCKSLTLHGVKKSVHKSQKNVTSVRGSGIKASYN